MEENEYEESLKKYDSLDAWMIDEIKDHLDEAEGRKVTGADLATSLFESENVDGSCTYSRYNAIQWISYFFNDIGDFFDGNSEAKDICGDPFENPEAFMVCVVIEKAESILGRQDSVLAFWDKEKALTHKLISAIKNDIDAEQ